jgi:hypothetical protein
MCYSNEGSMILEKSKKKRKLLPNESEDRLSNLPEQVLFHILSFLDTKHVVQTCVLSTKWIHVWKKVPFLMLRESTFSSGKQFSLFLTKFLTLRDSETALNTFYMDHRGGIEAQLLNYIRPHSAHLGELGLPVKDTPITMSFVSSCLALTCLKLSICPHQNSKMTLFPKHFTLPKLTSLDLTSFTFCGGENGRAEPFLYLKKLKELILCNCTVKDGRVLNLSSQTLINLSMHDNSSNFMKIELFAPSLSSLTYTGRPIQTICGSGLSSVKQVNIDADMYSAGWENPPMVLLNWLKDLVNVTSLIVSSITLQVSHVLMRL